MATADYCGIDVGKNGAIAFLYPNGKAVAIRMPVLGKEIDLHHIESLLVSEAPKLIVIEKQQAFPGQGVVSMFNLGVQYGSLKGLVKGLGFSFLTPSPKLWKKEILEGTAKDKAAAIRYVMQKYPDLVMYGYERRRKKEIPDGVADAVCLAEYGKLRG